MTAENQSWERDVLRNLRASSEARGMRFHMQPAADILPSFLAGYEPEAIAIDPRGGGGIVIEIERGGNRGVGAHLAELARKVRRQSGWEFRAIYMNRAAEEPDCIARATFEQIDAKLREVEVLADEGHYAPALILGWSVLEALARLSGGLPHARGVSPIQTVQALAAEGYLENEDARRLREMAKLRSAVVHGDLSMAVTVEQVRFLVEQLTAIRSYIATVIAEDGAERTRQVN